MTGSEPCNPGVTPFTLIFDGKYGLYQAQAYYIQGFNLLQFYQENNIAQKSPN